jgi:predicted MFS family arabinose efflux permease
MATAAFVTVYNYLGFRLIFLYYLGSALGGSLGGLAYGSTAWRGITLYCGALLAAALISAVTLRHLRRPDQPRPATGRDPATVASTGTTPAPR